MRYWWRAVASRAREESVELSASADRWVAYAVAGTYPSALEAMEAADAARGGR